MKKKTWSFYRSVRVGFAKQQHSENGYKFERNIDIQIPAQESKQ